MNYITTDFELEYIADAIKTSAGISGSLPFPSGFISGISSINPPVVANEDDLVTWFINGEPNMAFTYSGSLSSFRAKAFKDFSGLTELTANVAQVNANTFENCSNLKQVTLPNCEAIYGSAFASCSKLSTIYAPNVSLIGGLAFSRCTNLREVSFPECKTIGEGAFAYCASVTSLSLPKCETIGFNGFWGASNLESLDLPSCVTIEGYAFSVAYKLSSVSLPVCESIGYFAFGACSSLTEVYLPECKIIGQQAFYDCFNLSVLSAPECEEIYGSVVGLRSSSWYETKPIDVYIPNIKSIGAYAFCQRQWPRSSTLSLSMCETISEHAFSGNSYLTSLNLPVCSYLAGFQYCSSLTSVFAPSCEKVGQSAFCGCGNIQSISFPSCTIVYQFAFSGCSALSEVYLPNCISVTNAAFNGCTSLTHISLPACLSLQSAFGGCTGLVSIELDNVVYISERAFQNLYSLSSVYAPKVSYLYASTFRRCSAMLSADFPSCTGLGGQVFTGCTSLSYVNLPLCSAIGSFAFGAWYSTYSSSMNASACDALKSVNFPSCSYIYSAAFYSCSKLSIASFPVLRTVATSAFYGCHALNYLYLLGDSVATLASSMAFANTPMRTPISGRLGQIFVRASLLTAWQSATAWSYFSTAFVGLTDEEIADLEVTEYIHIDSEGLTKESATQIGAWMDRGKTIRIDIGEYHGQTEGSYDPSDYSFELDYSYPVRPHAFIDGYEATYHLGQQSTTYLNVDAVLEVFVRSNVTYVNYYDTVVQPSERHIIIFPYGGGNATTPVQDVLDWVEANEDVYIYYSTVADYDDPDNIDYRDDYVFQWNYDPNDLEEMQAGIYQGWIEIDRDVDGGPMSGTLYIGSSAISMNLYYD